MAGADDLPPFPFTPYAVQAGLMRAVRTTLDEGGVAICESPTGTGKSLSLLCATLHWLDAERDRAGRRRS